MRTRVCHPMDSKVVFLKSIKSVGVKSKLAPEREEWPNNWELPKSCLEYPSKCWN